MSRNSIEDETKLLVELSKLYPHFSFSALRKIMKQFNCDKTQIINYIDVTYYPRIHDDINQINNNWRTPQPSHISPNPTPVHKPKPKVTFSPACIPVKNLEPPRTRHASAPNRILVLPPSKSFDSASTNNDDQLSNLFSPDSLMGLDVDEFKKKCEISSIYLDDNYESKYLKLYSSFSRSIDELEADRRKRQNNDYLDEQRQKLKHLQFQVGDLLNDYDKLSVSNRELKSMKENGLDEDDIRKYVNSADLSTSIA